MQECDFEIIYRKGSLKVNADALSCQNLSCAATLALTLQAPLELRTSQQADQITSELLAASTQANNPPCGHEC